MDETMRIDDSCVHQIIHQIVKLAVDDWRHARRKLRKKPTDYQANMMVLDCENFFTSTHFSILTGLDGQAFMDELIEHEGEFHVYRGRPKNYCAH